MKCDTCRKEYTPDCDYRQGRCPLHPAVLDIAQFSLYNIVQRVKGWFHGKR
jgi:hypothetical protein